MRDDLRGSIERIVSEEVRSIGFVDGHDFDDLAQEARLAASLALQRVDEDYGPKRAYSYVRTSVHNALVSVKRNAHVQKRVPHNAWGRRVGIESLDAPVGEDGDDAYAVVAISHADPETTSAARELLRAIDARLDEDERASLFRVIAENVEAVRTRAGKEALQRAQRKAEQVLARMLRAPSIQVHEERGERILRERAHRVDDGARPTKGPTSEKEQTMAKAAAKSGAKVELPAPNFEKVTCHAANPNEADRIGYATPDDAEGHAGCVNCNDKFTCVPEAIKLGLVSGLSLDTDREVRAVLDGKVPLDSVLSRLRERRQIRKAGGTEPTHLLMENFSVEVPKAAEPEPEPEEPAAEEEVEETEEATEEVASETSSDDDGAEATDDAAETDESDANDNDSEKEQATMTTTKKGASKKAAKKAPAKAATPAPKKGAKKAATKKAAAAPRARIPAEKRIAIELPGGNRFLPQPRELTPEQMTSALEKVALGQPFDLGVGMQIVRKLRDGSEQVVSIKKNGFEFNGAVFSSLTAAAMHATGRSVNGNTHFNVATNSCTEIRGHGVPNGRYSKEGTAKAPAAKKAPAKKAAAKPAQKVTKAAPAPAKKASKKAPPPPPAKKSAKKK